MPTTVLPKIPENITVHLGPPNSAAENVTVPFPEYIKNVASSEIFPTWPDSALRANILANITFALNRIYTEWYPSKGYDFDITNSTSYDQAYQPGRDIFGNVSQIVDEIFNNYVYREGNVEPYFTEFCDGVNTTCPGLSQWGTVDLANQGKTPLQILQTYYGPDIRVMENTPVLDVPESYPGRPLQLGDAGNDVRTIQLQLNRIGNNYPAIPKIDPADGTFGPSTEDAVREFQKVFNLTQDGIVGKATWYKIKYIYNSVKKLGELSSEGLTLTDVTPPFETILREGSRGRSVSILQFYLAVLAYFNDNLQTVEVDGIFGPQTAQAVRTFQTYYGLTPDGIVGRNTWNAMQDAYDGVVASLPIGYQGERAKLFPGNNLTLGSTGQDVQDLQQYLNLIGRTYTNIPEVAQTGTYDEQTQAAVRTFQEAFGISPATGVVGPITWNTIANEYNQLTLSGLS